MPRTAMAGLLSLLLVAGVLGGLFTGTARADSAPLDPADPATPTTVTADALPTVQIDGVAWSQVVVGNTVYVAGKFGSARPAGAAPGTQLTTRRNLLAYDIRTGALITSFAPDLDGQALVVTASPDGSRIYVGGDFTRANGQVRNRIAAYDTATGALVPGFRPSVSGQVRAIAATNSTVYLGGSLTAVGSVGRNRLAAVSAANGAVLPWAPVPGVGPTDGNELPIWQSYEVPARDAQGRIIMDPRNSETSNNVLALVLTHGGTQVVAAGRFDTLNGVKATGIGALDAATGATRPFAVNQVITNQGVNSAVYSLSTDGTNVYGTAYDWYGPGNMESAFAAEAAGGRLVWASTCRGDTYSSHPMGGALYTATHVHQCHNIGGALDSDPKIYRFGSAFSKAAIGTNGPFTFQDMKFAGAPAPAMLAWWPTFSAGTASGQSQAGWSVTGNDQYLVYAGEFPRVNGVAQQGLVRFTVPGSAPGRISPTGGGLTPSVVSLSPGTARVTWRESNDQDNENLTYRVYRDGGATPVHEVTTASSWYDQQLLGFTDTGLTAGTHTYRVGVVDPSGNRNTGASATVTVAAGSTPARSYVDMVRADGATNLWSLGERSGTTTSYDRVGGNDLTVNSGVALGQADALAGDSDTGATLNGTTSGLLATKTKVLGPQTFALEAWINTTTRVGGKIIGFGDAPTGTSRKNDRHIYMNAAGQLNFGVWPTTQRVVSSPAAYNDGRWHHVVGTMTAGQMVLYVDGRQVGARTDTSWSEPNLGHWRIGGDTTWSGAQYFAGRIDEVAVYPRPLTAAQVADHHAAGSTGTPANVTPTASFTSSVAGLTASVDGSASTDPDGTITAWDWAFGDGTTGTGRTATHTYAAPGTYGVTLRVTDSKGATASRTATVTVAAPAPNSAPTADFSAAGTGRSGAFDASAAKDADGTVTGYAWDFGDGSTGTGVRTTHDYAAAGTYQVTLTVTDDDGATTTARQSLTLVDGLLAADDFNRTTSGGLGTAGTGGAWTALAGGTRQSVAPGVATLRLDAAGNNTSSHLGDVSQTGADVRTTFSLSEAPTGNGTYVYVSGRRVAAGQEYRVRVRLLADGRVGLALSRLAGGVETFPGGEQIVPGLTHTPGQSLAVRVQVTGTGTTQVQASVWRDGAAEPATPTLVRSDTTAALQAAGSVGLMAHRPAGTTAATAVRFTAFTVTAAR